MVLINENIKMNDIKINKNKTTYEQEEEIKEYKRKERDQYLNKKDTDDDKVLSRLKEIGNKEGNIEMEVEEVSYKDCLDTNIYYRENYYEQMVKDSFLEENKEHMANYMETTGVLVTLDGSYVFKEKVDKELDLSFEGMVDELRTGTLEDNLDVVVYKELEKSLCIKSHEIEKIQILNMFRDRTQLETLGLLFYITVNLKDEEIKERFAGMKTLGRINFLKNIKDVKDYQRDGYEVTTNVQELLKSQK